MTPLVSSLPILTVPPLDAPVVVAPGGAEEAFALILSQQGNSAGSLLLSDQTTAEAPFNGGTLSEWWPEQETTEQVATDAQVSDALAAHFSDHVGTAVAPVPIERPAVVHQPSTPMQACVCDDIRIPPVALPNLVVETSGQAPEPAHAAEGKAAPVPIQENGPSDPETGPWPSLERMLPMTMGSFSTASSAAVSPQPSMPNSRPSAPTSLSSIQHRPCREQSRQYRLSSFPPMLPPRLTCHRHHWHMVTLSIRSGPQICALFRWPPCRWPAHQLRRH